MKTFTRTISPNEKEAHRLINEALLYFQKVKQQNLAPSVDEYYYRLALDETLTNAIKHGGRSEGSEAPKEITLTIKFTKKGIKITVSDTGEGFDPAALPDPRAGENVFKGGGRGVFILNTVGEVSWDKRRGCVEVAL